MSSYLSQNISFFVLSVLKWYENHKRSFPWRVEKDPYRILIAEIMLQRTRAPQVLPVYVKFLQNFPNIESVSNANTELIEELLYSLGLRRRTEIIKNMAEFFLKNYEGIIPDDPVVLKKVNGIGQYVSDAMGVFAFNRRITVIDSNVVRIVTRFFGITETGEIRYKKNFVKFCQGLSEFVMPTHLKEFNWAVLDLGALVCIRKPRCDICPLSERCEYRLKQFSVPSTRTECN